MPSHLIATSLRIVARCYVAPLSVVIFGITPAAVLAQENALTNVSARGATPASGFTGAEKQLSPSQKAIQLNEQAVKLIFDGKSAQGKAKFEEAMRLDPDNPTVLYNYAGICLTEGKSADAVGAMEKAVKADPHDLALWNRLAEANFASSDLESAIKHYEKIIAIDPKFEQAMFRLGTLYGMRQQWDLSESMLRKALDANKDDARILANLGSVLVLREKYQEAIDLLNRAHFESPNAEVEMSLAIAHDGLKNPTLALEHYKRAKELGLKDDGLEKRITELQATNK